MTKNLFVRIPEKQDKMLDKLVVDGRFHNKQEAIRGAIRELLFSGDTRG